MHNALIRAHSRLDYYCSTIIFSFQGTDSRAYNSGEQIWKEKETEEREEKKTREKSVGMASVFNSALQSVRADVDRQTSESKIRKSYGFGGNSAMDAVVQEKVMTEEDKYDHERKSRMKKLSDQYRGKFPRIDGIGNVKDKAVAVLHFSAGWAIKIIYLTTKNLPFLEQGFNMGITDALDAGVEVNSRRNGKSALLRTIVDGKRVNLESARLLLRNDADADFQDANGNTFLHLAVSAAHVSAVDAVLRHGPSLELKNNSGLTAWGLAQTKKGGGNVEIVRGLLIQAWKRYKNKRAEDKIEMDSNLVTREVIVDRISKQDTESTTSNVSTTSDKNLLQRKSLISAANCGAQDQIKSLLLDPHIDVNEQSAKVTTLFY